MSKRKQPDNATQLTASMPVLYSAIWSDETDEHTGIRRRKCRVRINEFHAIERTATEFIFDGRFQIFDKTSNRHRISEVEHVVNNPGDAFCDVAADPTTAVKKLANRVNRDIEYHRREAAKEIQRLRETTAALGAFIKSKKSRPRKKR